MVGIRVEEENSILKLEFKENLSKQDVKDICGFLKSNPHGLLFKTIEIDLGSTLIELTEIVEKLIRNSCLYDNDKTLVIINMGKLDLPYRINCLRYLRDFKIIRYKINYFKK